MEPLRDGTCRPIRCEEKGEKTDVKSDRATNRNNRKQQRELHFQQRLAPLARAAERARQRKRETNGTSNLKYALLNPARPRAAAEIMCTIRTWSLALAVQVVHVSSAPGTQYGTHAVAIRNVDKRREKAVVPHASLPLLRHLHTRIESSLFVCPDSARLRTRFVCT